MVTYIVRLYRKDNVAQDPAAGIVENPVTGIQNTFTSAQELWSIINGGAEETCTPLGENKNAYQIAGETGRWLCGRKG